MKVISMGNIAEAYICDDLPAMGIVIEATLDELERLPNLSYKEVEIHNSGDCAKLCETIRILRTALKEIRNDVLDMVMNHKSEDPDSYAHGLCLSIGGACDIALNYTDSMPFTAKLVDRVQQIIEEKKGGSK